MLLRKQWKTSEVKTQIVSTPLRETARYTYESSFMAKTITESFKQLRTNLEITDLQQETVSTRQQNVRAAVEKDLKVYDTFLTGSYRRSTMIAPLSTADVDIFVVLDVSYYDPSGQAALLERVRRTLLKTYTKTPSISRNGQAVTIRFSDFVVDVVPSFYLKGDGFLIPDTSKGRWIATDPKKHVELWSASNQAHNGDLIPLIKMLKAWNRENGSLLRSFHLESLTRSILAGVKISDFPSGVRFVLDRARTAIGHPLPDPAGFGGDLWDYLDTAQKVADVSGRLQTAFARAKTAEQLDAQGKPDQAIDRWRLIFGDAFPVYG